MSSTLEALIAVEEGMEQLYLLFADKYAEHADFWQQLAREEQKHAMILKELQVFSRDKIEAALSRYGRRPEEFEDAAARAEKERQCYAELDKSIYEALETALTLEEAAGEIHHQFLMMTEIDDEVLQTIKRLTGDDKDHASRVRTYLEELNASR